MSRRRTPKFLSRRIPPALASDAGAATMGDPETEGAPDDAAEVPQESLDVSSETVQADSSEDAGQAEASADMPDAPA